MGRQTKRAFWHDYRSVCRYMITLSKAPGVEPFSHIDAPRQIRCYSSGHFATIWSDTGKIIADTLYHIDTIDKALRTEQYVIMPDHVHFVLNVREQLPRHIGDCIAALKAEINRRSGRPGIFESGFNDQIITYKRNLNDIFLYVKSNPYRWSVRELHPEYFRKYRNVYINNREVQLYGNPFLLRNPFKTLLIVHRRDTETEFRRKLDECLYTAQNGGVVVSPFISKREREIRNEIESAGGKIILIHNHPFDTREKPSRHNFEQCSKGELLMVSPTDYAANTRSENVSRQQCLDMNTIASALTRMSTDLISHPSHY